MALEDITGGCMLAALVAYVVLGGADFGAGVWDLLAFGPRRAEQRARLAAAIGPIWEANHVWLILVVVLMFTCFPGAFAAWMTALHVPLTLLLIGIVLRGSSFVFRQYGSGPGTAWGRVFSIASLVTPVLLGVCLAAGATGRLRWVDGVYVSGFFAPWLDPFCWSVGFFVLAVFAFLAAVYMCAERDAASVVEDFRTRALIAAVAVGLMAAITWRLAYSAAPQLSSGLTNRWWTHPLQIVTGMAAVGAIVALWQRRYITARLLAVMQVSLIVVGYCAALYPYLLVPGFTINNSAAPRRTHELVLTALAAGSVLLLPSLYYLMRIFKGRRAFELVD